MKRCDKELWGLFTLTPQNDKSYVWFIKREDDHFIKIPLWTDQLRKRIIYIPFEECLKLANDYEDFLTTCEWF